MTNLKHIRQPVPFLFSRIWSLNEIRILLFSLLFSLFSFHAAAQEVSAEIDTDSIKIGEQITYSIVVETDSTNLVVFPEGQTFSPLEMVEASAIDSSLVENRMKLIKEYALTQFDSGAYTIPQQRILINKQQFLTDSMLVAVSTVKVDTTVQKLYPIKPALEVPQKFQIPAWIWWVLLGLILLGLLIYLYFRRKKKKEAAAKKLPPYEQAIFELEQLDNSHLLEDREIKEYYSQLSGAVRRYLDGEVYDHALESTSGELLLYLETEKRTGKLNLEESTIEKLRVILQRSDLAKFANSKPDVITAKEDRSNAEWIINDTKTSIPEPTEEELQKDLEYRKKAEKKKKRRKIVIGALLVLVALGAFTTYMVSTRGFAYIQDTVFGNPTKELLKSDWIRSEYGNPSVAITTPEVLIRVAPKADEEPLNRNKEGFKSGKFFGNYFVEVTTLDLPEKSDFSLETAIDEIGTYLEKQGARNIISKQEKFTTINGAEGIKVFGTFDIKNPVSGDPVNKEYAILNFVGNKAFQQIKTIYSEKDTYADEITKRILNSVELINPGN